MNHGHPIENNELLHCGKNFSELKVFNASGISAEQTAQSKVLAQVRTQFPYPPKNCEDALATIQSINDEIKIVQEKIAGGATNRVGQRYLTAYNSVLAEFKAYINIAKCVEKAIQQDNEVFSTQLQEALDKENTTTQGKKKMDNAIIFGGLGLLLIGGLVLIFKR